MRSRSRFHRNGTPRLILGRRAHVEHVREGAFGDQQGFVRLADEDAKPFADKVVRYLVELFIRREVERLAPPDGLVDRVGEPRLERGIHVGQLLHERRVAAGGVHRRMDVNRALSQRPRLIRAEHVHAAKVFDCRQTPDDHVLGGHSPGAVSEVYADDRRQQLRRHPHRQRQRKHHRLQHRSMKCHVAGKDRQHQQQRHFQQKIAEAANAVLELGLRRPQRQPIGHLAKLRVAPRADHQHMRRATHDVCAQVNQIRAQREWRVNGHHADLFLGRKRLARQRRFVDE